MQRGEAEILDSGNKLADGKASQRGDLSFVGKKRRTVEGFGLQLALALTLTRTGTQTSVSALYTISKPTGGGTPCRRREGGRPSCFTEVRHRLPHTTNLVSRRRPISGTGSNYWARCCQAVADSSYHRDQTHALVGCGFSIEDSCCRRRYTYYVPAGENVMKGEDIYQ